MFVTDENGNVWLIDKSGKHSVGFPDHGAKQRFVAALCSSNVEVVKLDNAILVQTAASKKLQSDARGAVNVASDGRPNCRREARSASRRKKRTRR